MKQVLVDFKNLKISIAELKNSIGMDLYNIDNIKSVKVTTQDVINSINMFTSNEITKDGLVDWVNVVWFTDLFFYDASQEDAIASVMSLLETLDEENVEFSKDDFRKMINALENNVECTL